MELVTGVRAILFDLDGTLVDTAPDIAAAVDASLRELERPSLDDAQVRSFIGRGVDVLLHRALTRERDGRAEADEHAHARERFLEHYAAHNGRTAKLYPGVREGIDHAHRLGLTMCCVTNKLQNFSEALLALTGLDRDFAFVQGGDALPKTKPDPLPLLHAAQQLGIGADDCVYVGDDERDILAARAARMPSIAALWGYRLHDDDPATWQADVSAATPRALLDPAAWPQAR